MITMLFIWSFAFIIGLGACGIEAAYFNQSINARTYSGVYAAWCNLREAVPYVFEDMMAAKVGTDILDFPAQLGAMRISEEIDALEVMGVDSMLFLCATRLLAAWIVLPFMHRSARSASPTWPPTWRSWISSATLPPAASIGLLAVPESSGLLYSVIKGITMATAIVLLAI